MCGIFFSVPIEGVYFGENESRIEDGTYNLLRNRGPDSVVVRCVRNAVLGGFVLWHQGYEMTAQPLEEMNHFFLFNGDIFNVPPNLASDSDTKFMFHMLIAAQNNFVRRDFLNEVHGPYCFVLYNKITKEVLFGRDRMGRNSLLIEFYDNQFRILSASYYDAENTTRTMEVYPLGLYSFNAQNPRNMTLYPWRDSSVNQWSEYYDKLEKFVAGNLKISDNLSLSAIEPERQPTYDFYKLCDKPITLNKNKIYELLCNPNILTEVDTFASLLDLSVRDRIMLTKPYCKKCLTFATEIKEVQCNHSKIAIFFSGGIDCTILAMLVHKYVPIKDSIDLINVAFEMENCEKDRYEVPDRITAENAFEELKFHTMPREWKFVQVNVTRAELKMELENRIKYLIYPLETVLDESIGCAFWFAARGFGTVEGEDYVSPARVVILGTGADELFGGYMRHRKAFTQCNGDIEQKNERFRQELEKDWQRIPMRNLGRDDRVIGDWGKTARMPYIEERVAKFVRDLHPGQICCFNLEEGIGDKLFLRLLGYRLNFLTVPTFRKRAIQFGSRIANKKQNAPERSNNLIRHSK